MNERKYNEFSTLFPDLQFPEMILFDYGHTLLQEPGWNPGRGIEELMKYISENPCGYTMDDIMPYVNRLIEKDLASVKLAGYDVTWRHTARFLSELLQIKLSVSEEEAEIIFWNAETAGDIMPEADILLATLTKLGIRTAVVSNLTMSSAALNERINRLLPENNIEFVITSSDYIFRKPNPLIFKLALSKARLHADKVWFCGDNPHADIEGSAAVGIFPVWYESEVECPYRDKEFETIPKCPMLHIRRWPALLDILSKYKVK